MKPGRLSTAAAAVVAAAGAPFMLYGGLKSGASDDCEVWAFGKM